CTDAYYTGLVEADLKVDPQEIAKQIADTPFEKDNYLKRLITSLETKGSFPRQPCYAGVLMARIDPWGNVYPCLEQHVRIGSVREEDFASIWNSDSSNKERRRLANNRPCSCWYNNTALIGHYGKLLGSTPRQVLRGLAQNNFIDYLPSVFSEKK
ncbi:MAG: SPASM domain-containing protein, partial [Deltaproteobacteria bacterium]|nr:SPASM domain-containing protein [Deltaproteobacteria bacterium]